MRSVIFVTFFAKIMPQVLYSEVWFAGITQKLLGWICLQPVEDYIIEKHSIQRSMKDSFEKFIYFLRMYSQKTAIYFGLFAIWMRNASKTKNKA